MDKVYDLKLTRVELEAVAVGFASTADRLRRESEDADALQAVADSIVDKAGLLLHVVEASEAARKTAAKCDKLLHNAKLARTAAWNAYNNAVKGVHIDADGVARDADGIPVLPFE